MTKYKVGAKSFNNPRAAVEFARGEAERTGQEAAVIVEISRSFNRVHRSWMATMYPPGHKKHTFSREPAKATA